MRTTQEKGHRFVVPWLLTWSVPAAVQLLFASALSSVGVVGSPTVLFWIVVLAAGACALTSGAVIGRGVRRRESELVYLGLFFMSVSVLPLVHGITTPGVLYGDNTATMSAVQWSIPVALLVAAPLLFPRGMRLRYAERLCRTWTASSLVGLLVLAAALLMWTNLLPVLEARSLPALTIAVGCAAGCIALSYRHLYLAQVAQSRLPLIISIGFGFVGGSALVWFGAEPFSAGFWVAHVLDICGVFAGTVGALVTLRSTSKIRATIEPVLATEPMAALELGMDPIVHKFVGDLEARDTITRDHVVRTAELAVKIGTEMGLRGRELRKLGLTALLHDVGKLDIPTSILNKPGRLDEDEYNVMKRHAAFGQAMVETSPALADIGIFIRGHHERIDGNGYPDGRSGRAIPLISRIVAVCDSFDAMANTRQYRNGMGVEKALAILREHAGTQWDAEVVAAAERVIERDPPAAVPAFDQVGRNSAQFADHDGPQHLAPVGCDCLPVHAMAGIDDQRN